VSQIFELEGEVARLKTALADAGADKQKLRAMQDAVDKAKQAMDAANAESKELRGRLKKMEAAKAHDGDEFDVRVSL
jgi:hypothetical protein